MGVSNKTWSTDAYGTMVFDLTVCPNSTGQCKAWVFTFLVYACKMRGAVRVNQAFWLRSWKGKFHASKESLNLIATHLWTTNSMEGGQWSYSQQPSSLTNYTFYGTFSLWITFYIYMAGLCMTRVKLQPFVPTHLNHKVVQYFCLTYVGCTLCVGIQYSHLDRYTLDCDWQPCKGHLGHMVCLQHMDWCIFCFCRMCNLDSRHLIHTQQTAVELRENPLKERKEGNFMQKIGYEENH